MGLDPQRQDVGFAPVGLEPARRLTKAEIMQYDTFGFVQPFDIFGPAEIAEIRACFDRLMADLGEAGAYGINCYQARMAGIWDIATDLRILDVVQNIVCWASAILSRAPGDAKRVPWHQDASFRALRPARTMTVWLAIDDADAENAGMRFIPGSHGRSALETSAMGADSVFHIGIAEAERHGAPFINTLKAGQVSLHADMPVHGSAPNRSDRRRCGLTLRHCPLEVEITDPVWARGVEAIVDRGSDPTGRWRRHPRPGSDDIRATSRPHVAGNNWAPRHPTRRPHKPRTFSVQPTYISRDIMQITSFGPAAFKLTDSTGRSVILDPDTPEGVGYAPLRETADLFILSSDDDSAHCRADLIPGMPEVVNAPDVAQSWGGGPRPRGSRSAPSRRRIGSTVPSMPCRGRTGCTASRWTG